MDVLRTPEDRFVGLADWPFAPRYAEIYDRDGAGLRIHYVDEGPRRGAPVLLMHGEPTWSYLYRKIIPLLVAKGHRAVAPDLIGFGRSDKPARRADYTYERHVEWMTAWLEAVDLNNITLFCQDWGGLIGLRLVAAFPERFAGVIVSNTGLPTGAAFSEAFDQWVALSQSIPEMPIGAIVAGGTVRTLSEAERAAYDAPFPDETFKAGARQFPVLVPVTPKHASVRENVAAWQALEAFNRPFVTAFSDGDPITRGGDELFRRRVRGAQGQNHVTLSGGHFVQEDSPAEIADLIDAMITTVSRSHAHNS